MESRQGGMLFCAASAPTHSLALIMAMAAVISAPVLGCSLPASTRARALPELVVTFRRAWRPHDVSVHGVMSFPLRRVQVRSAIAPADASPYGAALDEFERDASAAVTGAWTKEARRTCQRADTCAWERVHRAQALAAWGGGP